MKMTLKEINRLEKYFKINLINKLAGLRSANLLGTISSDGISNLAIFNSVMHIGANPPLMGLIMRPTTVERHTYENIKSTRYFTINHISVRLHERAHQTSAKYSASTSEFDSCNIGKIMIDDFPAPFVEESKVKIGLSFVEEQFIMSNGTILIVGQVEKLVIDDNAIDEHGDIDFERLETAGIGGLDTYYRCERIAQYPYDRVQK